MATNSASDIHIRVRRDKLAAAIIIPADFPREMLSHELCFGVIRAKGIHVTKLTDRAVDTILSNPPPIGEQRVIPIARGTLACAGDEGRIEWVISAPELPDSSGDTVPVDLRSGDEEGDKKSEDGGHSSHYERIGYQSVKAGDVIARIVEPTAGEDGIDVYGMVVPMSSCKPVQIKLDESVQRCQDGTLIALVDGILRATDKSIAIETALKVDGVDFSTGNVRYEGDVVVGGGVKDCFEIHAGGCLEIQGLIGDAKLHCGGDLIARSGFAVRKHGEMHVGGRCQMRYLDKVQGKVGGDLVFEREMLHCKIHVGGTMRSPTGTMVGGSVAVQGAVELGHLGSEAGVETKLVIGSVPNLENFLGLLDDLVYQIDSKKGEIQEQQRILDLACGKLTPKQKELQTEVMFEHSSVDEQDRKARGARDAIKRRIQKKCGVNLMVHGTIYSGVLIRVGQASYLCGDNIRGPIRIRLDDEDRVIYERGVAGHEKIGLVETLLQPYYTAA